LVPTYEGMASIIQTRIRRKRSDDGKNQPLTLHPTFSRLHSRHLSPQSFPRLPDTQVRPISYTG
jgi:hypothetical protein